MAKDRSLLARLVGITGKGEDADDTILYPTGMAEAAREAQKRLKQRGRLQAELDAQKEINGRVSEFGKAA